MVKSTRWMFLIAVLVISSMLLSACGGESPTATTGTTGGGAAAATDTPAAAGAAATNTTAPAAGGAATDTPAAAGGAATDTPAAASGGATSSTFDPTKYKKNAIESGATLRVASWGDTSEQGVNRDALKRFNQIYPDVKITYEPIPDQYDTKLLAQIKGGSQPDVFYVDPDTAYQLIPAGVLEDLTPALTETGRSADDYFPNILSTFQSKDGKVYGVPKDFGAVALFYNTDMVKTPPKADWTQDDFAAFVKENNSGSGATQVFGFSADADFQRWGAFAYANGASVIDNNNKCAINSQAGVDTLTWWYGMYKDKIATIPADVGAGWSGEAFAKKRIASTAQGGWLIPFLDDPKAAFGVKYDAAPLPQGKAGKATLLFYNAWGAAAKSKFPKAAAALALFLASRENEGAILQTGFALPALKGFDNDPYFQGSSVQAKISKLLYAAASYGKPGYYGGAADPKVTKALGDATQRVFAKQQDAKAALDQACQEIDAALAAVK